MLRRVSPWIAGAVLAACSSEPPASPPTIGPLPTVTPVPVATAPVPPPAPPPSAVTDISGRWECIWSVQGGSGTETWMLLHEGSTIRVTLTGRDPGGRYTGSMTGTIADRRIQLAYEYHDRTRGTMSLTVSSNGQVIDGDSTRAAGGNVAHYGCSRRP